MPTAWLRRNVFHPALPTTGWRFISRISRRISDDTVGRPQQCRDFQRQYDLKPVRCQRMTVSSFTIVSEYLAPNDTAQQIRRSIALKASLFGRCRLDVKLMTKDQDLSFQRDRDRNNKTSTDQTRL